MPSLLPLDIPTPPPSPDLQGLPHVLLVLDQFPKNLGGGERVALKLASLLPAYGLRVSILTFFIHPESTVRSSAPCPVYVLPLKRTYDLTALRAAFTLRRFLKDQKVQIVQTFFESSDIWAGFVTKAMSSAKLIWSRRDLGILRTRKHSIAYRLMSKLPDAVFAVSNQVRDHCIQVDGVDPARVHTIYNGLDLSRWSKPRTPRDPSSGLLVATVGNIRHVKGHDILIRAAAIVVSRFPCVRFSVAGAVLEEDYFAQLQDLIKDLDLTANFSFVGDVTDLHLYLASADIFVLPSRSEGFSNALIEAMAAALPLVASNVGGNGEAIQQGVNGLLVPADDPAPLADAIVSLLANPGLANSMGANGREIAAQRFTTEAMMNETVAIYRQVLHR
jgi:glycosyltransferase involved in cell wall biosynthesis